ncbi:MAG: glycosyltransferase [Bacteroidales bacterium]
MKVLHVAHWFPSKRNVHSGIFVKEYCNAIHEPNPEDALIIAVEIIQSRSLLTSLRIIHDETSRRIKVIRIETGWVFHPVLYIYPQLQWIRFRKIFLKIAEEFGPDIIHAHVVHPSGALAYKLASALKLPLIITEHWSNLPYYVRQFFSSYLGKKAYKAARFILPVSEFLRRMILSVMPELDPDKIRIVPDVVDEHVFHYAEKVKGDKVRFVAVSSWQRYKHVTKRPDIVIKSLGKFAEASGHDIHLTIIGDGNMLDEMKVMADEFDGKGLTVDFAGRKTKPEIAGYLHHSDFFIHASNVETFSLVTAEALMTGTPVIVSDRGALPYLVNDENGIVCENEPEAWVAGLEKLLTGTYDHKSIAEKMQSSCSYEGVRKRIVVLYTEAIR